MVVVCDIEEHSSLEESTYSTDHCDKLYSLYYAFIKNWKLYIVPYSYSLKQTPRETDLVLQRAGLILVELIS